MIHRRLRAHRVCRAPNIPLQQVMLIAVEFDVLLKPCWLESKANGSANTLSYFTEEVIADLYPHWQNSLSSMLQPSPGCSLSEDRML